MEDVQIEPLPETLPVAQGMGSKNLFRKFSVNALVSLLRVAVNSVVALLLPAFLTHRLPVETYGAWVLILQVGSYVSFLDFGVQTGVAKFVAEYDAANDQENAGRYASAGLAMMLGAAILGLLLTCILAWQVPRLFNQMSAALYPDVRTSVLLIGISLSFGLICSVYSAVFIGLQRYTMPTMIAITNRILTAIVIAGCVWAHGTLTQMGLGVALVNICTGLAQLFAHKRWASAIPVALRHVHKQPLIRVLKYCLILALWSASTLCISGLDVTLTGHYAFSDTAYYSLATLPINLLLLIVSSVLAPFMPVVSALSTKNSPREMGDLMETSTRYTVILFQLVGLPLMVFGLILLRIWVGPVYAAHGIPMLQILVLATIVRGLCLPYSLMVLATGQQKFATVATLSEAAVNFIASLFLVRIYGGIGVALGTLIGAWVSVVMHFIVSMRYTMPTLAIPRLRLVISGMLRPLWMAVPSLFLIRYWWGMRSLSVAQAILWSTTTLLCMTFAGLRREDRLKASVLLRQRLSRFTLARPS